MRTLVAGVGYRNLRDLSFGPILIERLQEKSWPEGVEIEDLSYGPIGILHHLDEQSPFERMVFVAGVKRDRTPGEVYEYRWQHRLPEEEEIQARVVEAATGVISLDNLLIIATYFHKLSREVVVIEVEAADENWGEHLSPPIEALIPKVVERIEGLVVRAA